MNALVTEKRKSISGCVYRCAEGTLKGERMNDEERARPKESRDPAFRELINQEHHGKLIIAKIDR